MPVERGRLNISVHEDVERAHSASRGGPVVALPGVEYEGVHGSDTDEDRVAHAAGAVGPHTQTDPLRLLENDDRPGSGLERERHPQSHHHHHQHNIFKRRERGEGGGRGEEIGS